MEDPYLQSFRKILSDVLSQAAPDVTFDAVVGSENTEMTLTKDIGFDGQNHFHGHPPLGDIGSKGWRKGAVDVLTEKNPLAISFQQDDDRAWSVTRRMDAMKSPPIENEDIFLTCQTPIDGRWWKIDVVPIRRRSDGITILHCLRIHVVDGNL